jgi:hypothetical protein
MHCTGCGKLQSSDNQFCDGCGTRLEASPLKANTDSGAAAATAPARIDPIQNEYIASRLSPELQELKGIGGWLMWFCVSMIVIKPLLDFSEADLSRPVTIAFATLLAALSLTTGITVYKRKPSAFKWLKWYFGVYLAIMLLAAAADASEGSSKALVGDLRGVFYVFIWVLYFTRSKRVLANFGRNLW